MEHGNWYNPNTVYAAERQYAGVPGGLVGGPRAHQDQLRGFKSHRVHARRGIEN